MKPKSYKELLDGVAEEVGVHPNVVDDFVSFYYSKVRKTLSSLSYPYVMVDNLGTFFIRKNKLDKLIKRQKDILGNLGKQTYNGYEKTTAVKEKLVELNKISEMYTEVIKEKKEFQSKKNGAK